MIVLLVGWEDGCIRVERGVDRVVYPPTTSGFSSIRFLVATSAFEALLAVVPVGVPVGVGGSNPLVLGSSGSTKNECR